MGYSPPRVHRIYGGYGDLVIVYPKPISYLLNGDHGRETPKDAKFGH